MRLAFFLLITLFITAPFAYSQSVENKQPGSDEIQAHELPIYSPFNHLEQLSFQKTTSIRPYNCLKTYYYNPNTAKTNYPDSIPTRVWATKMTLPANPAVHICTTWTVGVDFNWTPDSPGDIDTLHIFMREVTPPYNEFYHSKYLMKLGDNTGEFEIDPPVPPYSRPIINPKRDVYVGLYVSGKPGNKITWRIKSPGQYTSPPRSFIFTTSTTPVPASSIVGTTADWVFDATFCCDFAPPVELSVFSGVYDGTKVNLEWKTETETNNHHFEVQRSSYKSGPWETRGYVPGNGSTLLPTWYEFPDPVQRTVTTPPSYWYRLRQMDFDGTISELPPIRVNMTSLTAADYKLHAAYPNPISRNNYTTIAFEVPDESPVTITVFDALGKEIATLVDQVLPAGYHETLWFTGNSQYKLQQGTYFIVMKSSFFAETRKITVLK